MNPESIARAAEIIRAGGVVAYPTEACFGLGCDPRNASAVQRILRVKRRARDKGLILIAAESWQLRGFVDMDLYESSALNFGDNSAANTWLLPATRSVSRWLRGDFATLAVRITKHRDAAKLCRAARTAIVSTSANRSGMPMLRCADLVRREFGDEVDFVVDGKVGDACAPSTIRDAASGVIVRG